MGFFMTGLLKRGLRGMAGELLGGLGEGLLVREMSGAAAGGTSLDCDTEENAYSKTSMVVF